MDAVQGSDKRTTLFWLKTQTGWPLKHQLEIAKAQQGGSIKGRQWTFEVMSENSEDRRREE